MAATVENTATKINGKSINGLNPDAVAELESRGTASEIKTEKAVDGTTTTKPARKMPEWSQVTGTLAMQASSGLIHAKEDFEFTYGGKTYKVTKGTEINPLQWNADRTIYKCRIRDAQFPLGVPYPINADLLEGPAGNSPAPRSRANDINDDLAEACKTAVTLVGKMPVGTEVGSKTLAEWQATFPNCTLDNVADALIKIEEFRANRKTMLADAIKAKDRAAMLKAIEEYRRAKSWEQDVFSTAKNCGVFSS